MNFKKLLELLEKGENLTNPLSGIIGNASGILNMLGIGRKRQIRQQKEMAENAAKINYKYGEMAAENAFERQQVLYNRTYQDQSYANKVAQSKGETEAVKDFGIGFYFCPEILYGFGFALAFCDLVCCALIDFIYCVYRYFESICPYVEFGLYSLLS